MSLKKELKNFILGISITSLAVLVFGTYVTFALFVSDTAQNGNYPGAVGLRSYFQKGDGSHDNPFVISRPVHFYNFTRLQNIGLLPEKYYFTLGYDPDHPNDNYGENAETNLRFYKDDSTSDMQSYLDMSFHPNILSLGSESSPFYGVFEGNGKEVTHLSVQSGPEDVGVFGYTYSGSIVRNVYFNSPAITDNGYDTNVSGLSTLYGDESTLPKTGDICYYDSANNQTEFTSSPSESITDLLGHFDVTLPSNPSISNISYLVRSSSEYFTVAASSGNHMSITINHSTDPNDETSLANNTTFTGTNSGVLTSRFSIIARIFKDGIYYSKVLKTYQITMTNTVTTASPYYSIGMSGALDYVNTVAEGETGYVDKASEYAHGVNIGFLIGHCDGSVQNCYVFGGTLNINETTSGLRPKPQESETGLIGEIGPAINNAFTPKKAYESNGDTGVVNFTKMYNDIAGSGAFTTAGGYFTYSPVEGTAKQYLKLLRQTYATNSQYVGNASNSIDFKGRRIIADSNRLLTGDETYNYGLGVFSLVTSSIQSDTNSTFTSGLGDFAVAKSADFTEFYYSTAEWVNDASLSKRPMGDLNSKGAYIKPWSYDVTYEDSDLTPSTQINTNHINQGYFLPTAEFVTPFSWSPRREHYFNYVFRCPLKSEASMNSNDYFYNTDSRFLQAYFNYKLIDKTGAHLSYDDGANPDFGVFIKNVSSSGVATNIETFNSSLKMSAPTRIDADNYNNDMIRTISTVTEDETAMKSDFGDSLGTAMTTAINGMPARSINFSIKSDAGANVTVMASSPQGNGGYVGVYNKADALSSANNAVATYANQRPSYAMYVPYTSTADQFAYFNYYPTLTTEDGVSHPAGSTDSVATWAAGGNKLFAHTFLLPKGDYFLGSPNNSVYIYYVCAQGQEGSGNTGRGVSIYSAMNTITDVDFISRSSNDASFVLNNDRCNLSFASKFSSAAGSLSVVSQKSGTANATAISKPDNLTQILIYNQKSNPVTFNGSTFTSTFKQWPSA